MRQINSYDIDGVIYMGKNRVGLKPTENDVIITGRSFEEKEETFTFLHSRGIFVPVFFNPLPFENKTRRSSGEHKGNVLKQLLSWGFDIGIHFEDDPIQAAAIREIVPSITVVELVHNLVDKENERRVDF